MAAEAVPALIATLRDNHEEVRLSAAEALGRIGPEATEAVPALIATLRDESESTREAAARALRRIEPDYSDESVPNPKRTR